MRSVVPARGFIAGIAPLTAVDQGEASTRSPNERTNLLGELMYKHTLRTRTLGVLGCLAFAATGLSSAPALAEDDELIEEVVVTGSRIARDAGSYVGPMTTLLGDTVTQNPNFSLNDALLEMPSIGAQGTSRNNANGGRGANFSGIHQLNPERTLTLYNGKRTVSTIRDPLGLGVDLQSFPVNMIDRVEILADGSSSVYGSDAVAGVINLIPKKDIDGFEISFGAGSPEEAGGDHLDASVLFGLTGDRGFFTAALSHVDDGDVDFQEREFSQIPLLGQLETGGQVLNLVGSGIPPQGRVVDSMLNGLDIIFEPNPETGESFQAYDTFCLGGGPGSDGSGSIECILNQGHRFNYNDIPTGVSLINGNKATNFSGIGEYAINDSITAYTTVNLAHREGRLNFTPLPVQGAAGRFTDLLQIPFSNPNIPADALAAIQQGRADHCNSLPAADQAACFADSDFQMSWRGLDLGPRTFDYDSDTLAATIGLRGDLAGGWEWDAWGTVGRSELFEVTFGQLNVANLQTAVDPEACARVASCPKDANGNPTLDIFGRNPKSQAEIDFTTFDDLVRTSYDMIHLAATVTGELGELPGGTIGVAGGAEYRDESGGVLNSGIVQNGDSGGNFAENTRGEYDVTEFYGEVSLPFLSGAPMAEELSADLALRWSDYNTFGDEFTYKVALGWAPNHSMKFRGTYATGYRAPNILELFGGTADTFQSVSDPCTAPISDPNVAANCQADGVPAGFVQPAAQLKISAGGNPNLDPETSDSFSLGFVYQPDWAQLRVSLDWYDVEVDEAIGNPDPVNVIQSCYNSPNGSLSSPDCARIGRGPAGDVVRFDLLNENLATIETSGLDLDVAYDTSTGLGDVEVRWLLNYLEEWKQTTGTGVVEDRTGLASGLVSSWAAYPEIRSRLNVRLNRDRWWVGATWRYLDEMDIFDVLAFDNVNTTADAVNYVDLDAGYDIGSWRFTAGIQNLSDEEPPYVTDVSANTSGIYDFLGRFYYARATVKLH